DRPYIHDLLAARDVVAVVDVRARVEVGAVDFHALAELDVTAGIGPLEQPVLRALRADLKPRHPLYLVGGAVHGLVAVVDRRLVRMALAVDGREHGERSL